MKFLLLFDFIYFLFLENFQIFFFIFEKFIFKFIIVTNELQRCFPNKNKIFVEKAIFNKR